jgi:hypothetical protein
MELDYQAAFIGIVEFGAGYALWRVGQLCSDSINQPVGRALLCWPCSVAGFLFFCSAVFLMIWNMPVPSS